MYKVFVNDNPIIFIDSIPKKNKFPIILFEELIVEKTLQDFLDEILMGVIILCRNTKVSFASFLKDFNVVSAGGGLVLNSQKEILFIYRNQVWDLPKGMIESGETIQDTALREVSEECGIDNLVIEKFLVTTYHFYFRNENCIKKTYWFLMHSTYQGVLNPQKEEGISQVLFKNKEATIRAMENTYANIKLVYNKYLDL